MSGRSPDSQGRGGAQARSLRKEATPRPARPASETWRHRAVLAAGISGFLALFLVVLVATEAAKRAGHAAIEQRAFEQAVTTGLATEQLLRRTTDGLELVFRLMDDRRIAAAAGDARRLAGIHYRLGEIASERRFAVLQVAAIEADGWNRWSTVQGAQPVLLADREHFRVHLERGRGLFVSSPLRGRVSGQLSLQFTRRLETAEGDFAGVSVISVDPLMISAQMAALMPPQGATATIMREDGTVIARSRDPAGMIGKAIPADHPIAEAIRAGAPRQLYTQSPLTGGSGYFSLHPVGGTGLWIGSYWHAEELAPAFERIDRLVAGIRIGAGLLVLAAAAVLSLVLHRSRQRRALREAAARQDALAQVNAELSRIVDGLPALIVFGRLHPDGRWDERFRSRNSALVTGWPEAEANAGSGFFDRREPEALQSDYMQVHATLLAAGVVVAEHQYRHPSGGLRWMRLTLRLVGRVGESLDVAGMIANVDAEKSAAAVAIATGRLATVGELAMGLAHELNQPLSIIGLAAENASEALASQGAGGIASARGRLERIGALVRRTRVLTDHLRLFGRRDEGEANATDLRQVLEGTLVLVGAALRSEAVKLDLDMPEALPPVRGKQTLLEQVLANLLLNARDALRQVSDPSGRSIRIAAQETAEGQVVLTVHDSGPGIPAHVLPRIFEPFFTTKPPGQGTGLGLPICHGIVTSFGGELRAENDPAEGGAVFTVVLPAAPEAAAPPAEGRAPSVAVAAAAG